jgi:hypothetical protein
LQFAFCNLHFAIPLLWLGFPVVPTFTEENHGHDNDAASQAAADL